MIDFHEIRIDFNKRGDPDYDSKDLNINQYSKNADKLSFNFEEESFQSVVFSAKRNDGEESPKIAMTLNPDRNMFLGKTKKVIHQLLLGFPTLWGNCLLPFI